MKINEFEMDKKLESPSQQAVSGLVGSLPEDTVNLAWRSQLNEKILAQATVQKKRNRLMWVMRPTVGLGLAALLVISFTFRPTQVVREDSGKSAGIELNLLDIHKEAAASRDITASGITANEARFDVNVESVSSDWSEEDTDSV